MAIVAVSLLVLLKKDYKEAEVQSEKTLNNGLVGTSEKEKKAADIAYQEKIWRELFETPINFWGRVVDLDGQPVADAEVEVILGDDPSWGFEDKNTTFQIKSDADGLFEVLERKGAYISIHIKKGGFTGAFDKRGRDLSTKRLHYATRKNEVNKQVPKASKPTLFTLRKKKQVRISHQTFNIRDIPVNGKENIVRMQHGDKELTVRVKCWSSAPQPYVIAKRYNWRVEIKIDRAGLQAMTDANAFVAPSDGYKDAHHIEMPKDTTARWGRGSPWGSRLFWVKMENGDFAKVSLMVNTGRKNSIRAESWYNLDRNQYFEK
eukprot:Seg21548.1 transcript_id=Seg21548.1/GoldUCD/mRNA.D3Y31 product="hypothetical protein" protein_id=Seg21548.1/GoldUCD/D3Y31